MIENPVDLVGPTFSLPRRRSSALLALHPDEATEAVVDAALALQKPFLVVPCCALDLVEALWETQGEVENYGGKNPGILGDFRRFSWD